MCGRRGTGRLPRAMRCLVVKVWRWVRDASRLSRAFCLSPSLLVLVLRTPHSYPYLHVKLDSQDSCTSTEILRRCQSVQDPGGILQLAGEAGCVEVSEAKERDEAFSSRPACPIKQESCHPYDRTLRPDEKVRTEYGVVPSAECGLWGEGSPCHSLADTE